MPTPRLSGLILASLLVGCALQPSPGAPSVKTGPMLPAAQHSPFAAKFGYAIDSVIAGRYGTTGEVGWADTGAGRRPSIFLLGEQRVTFQEGVTEADLLKFQEAFQAKVVRQETIPGTPDGTIPARQTETYYVTFETDKVDLDGFIELASEMVPGGSVVFSSEKAAHVFYQILRVRQLASDYKVRFIGFNAVACIPEDCGPDEGPVPVYPSVAPPPTPTPTPSPVTKAMVMESFECDGPRPLGKLGVVKVTAFISDGCWAPHEVKATLDEEKFEVRLEATQKHVSEVCGQAVSRPIVTATFHPKKPGVYKVIGTVTVDGKSEERTCELEMIDGDVK